MITQSFLKRKSKLVNNSLTPPMASRSRSSSESSFDEAYFSKTYVPLSGLPTPPPSSHSNISSRQQSPEGLLSPGEHLDPQFLGPAIHLTNLIPSSTSLTTASVPLVHAILTRANLPLEIIALAVCILDSLNSRFALQWRKGCPLITRYIAPAFGEWEERVEEQHIDSIHPEIIVLSSLIVAEKFLDDAQQKTKEYGEHWAHGLWSCPQINFTQRSLLENLGYRLLSLWNENIIIDALEDMERAGKQYQMEMRDGNENWDVRTRFGTLEGEQWGMSNGKAVQGAGESWTPAETPLVENVRGMRDVSAETKIAFQKRMEAERFELPGRSIVMGEREPSPLYIDPGVRQIGFGF